jgi:hypothetical protein
LGVFSIATFNIMGVSITKYINAIARSIADVTRTILVWGVGLIVTATAGSIYPNYKWELTKVGPILVELLGFVILVFGNIIYNEVVKLPPSLRQWKWRLKAEKDEPLLDGSEEIDEEKSGSLYSTDYNEAKKKSLASSSKD